MAAVLTSMAACTPSGKISEKDLSGSWLEVMPAELSTVVQGIILAEDGHASSIGMATLKYETWSLLPDSRLVLTGKSIGNGQTIDFSDTLAIESMKGDTLILSRGEAYRMTFVRQQDKPVRIGADEASTGYTWSEALQKKIRIFETGQKVLSATDAQATSAAFLVFTADSSKVEVFLPDAEKQMLDKRVRPDGTAVWNVEDDDTYQVQQSGDSWIVSRRGKLLYCTSGTKDRIQAVYAAGDGTEIPVQFYPSAEVVQLYIDGQNMLLFQYRTGSGYGYKNPMADLRGKGTEAILTLLSSGKKIQLKEKK